MNKKIGITFAVFFGILVLCCLSAVFYVRQFGEKLMTTTSKNKSFVKLALTDTAKTWDEKKFAVYADDLYNQPDKKVETEKLFKTLNENLGPLVSLEEPESDSRKPFHTESTGPNKGFYVNFIVHAKFTKRTGVFTVSVRNTNNKMTISAISLDPESSVTGANNNAPKP